MTTQQIYRPDVEHPPRLFEHGLPLDPVLAQEDLDRWAMDPFWECELLEEETLIVSPNAPGAWAPVLRRLALHDVPERLPTALQSDDRAFRTPAGHHVVPAA